MLYVASFTEAEDSAKLCPVNFESHDEQPKAHYDYYTGDPLDEDAYQQAKADELQAMEDYGVYEVIPITQAYDGKHIGGFPIAHNKEEKVRWRFVATEVNDGHREDNHQGTPPLMIVRAIVSLAASRPDSDGVFRRLFRIWNIRKAFLNANLNETLYLHPGRALSKRLLLVAEEGSLWHKDGITDVGRACQARHGQRWSEDTDWRAWCILPPGSRRAR